MKASKTFTTAYASSEEIGAAEAQAEQDYWEAIAQQRSDDKLTGDL